MIVQSAGTVVDAQRGPSAPSGARRSIFGFRERFLSYGAIYRTQPSVRTCVGLYARNVGQLGWGLFERKSKTDREQIDEHPLTRIMRRPCQWQSRHVWLNALVSDLLIFDDYFAAVVNRPELPRGFNLVRIPPYLLEPADDNWILPTKWRLLGNRNQPLIPDSALFHLHGYNPDDNRLGASPMETLRQLISESMAAGEYREQLWERGGRVAGVVSRPSDAPEWSAKAREQFLDEWRQQRAGNGVDAGGDLVLEDGMTWTEAVQTFAEAEYLGARKLSRAETAAAYYLDPGLVGAIEAGNVADAATRIKSLYNVSLPPLLDFVQDEFERQVLEQFGDLDGASGRHYVEFNLEEKLRGSFVEQAEVLSRLVGAPVLTRNEGRAFLNRAALDDDAFDLPITPLNVTVGGRASPADTAPGAPGGGQVPPAGPAALARERARELAHKAASFPPALSVWVAPHVEAFASHAERQKSAVMSALGAGDTPTEAFDLDRWNGELRDDLAGLALEVLPVGAAPIAEQFGIDFDPAAAEVWVLNNARIAAESFNAVTLAALMTAYVSAASRHFKGLKADDGVEEALIAGTLAPDRLQLARDVFALAAASRAATAGAGRVLTVGNFARHEAAQQAGAGHKTWHVTAANPRPSHAALAGETVLFGHPFSNGAQWPGDPVLPVDELAGCTCTVSFTA